MRRVIMVLLLAILLAVPMMLMMAQDGEPLAQGVITLTPTATQALDPLYLTATQLVSEYTQTAAVDITETASAPKLKQIDPLDMTATYVIGQATQNAAFAYTATACALGLCEQSPTPAIDPLDMSATYVIGQATESAVVQLTGTACALYNCPPTINPTLDPLGLTATTITQMSATPTQDVPALREQDMNILIAKLGFRSPLFDKLVDNFLANAPYSVRNKFDPEVATTFFAGSQYVAAIIPYAGDAGISVFQLFHVVNGAPELINNPIPSLYDSQDEGLTFDTGPLVEWNGQTKQWVWDDTHSVIGFADRNKNGLPDLALWDEMGGSCCNPLLKLIEIQQDGHVIEITPKSREVLPYYFTDSDHDGRLEIIAMSGTSGLGDPDPALTRWYGWDGSAYVDVSVQHLEFYMPVIDDFLNQIKSSNGVCYPLDYKDFATLRQVLGNYYVIGQLKEGWRNLSYRLGWGSCSPSVLQSHGNDMIFLLEWIISHES